MTQVEKRLEVKSLKLAAITLQDLCFGYSGKSPILNHINLKIFPQEKVGLIGKNGTGKTTLFLSICGVITPTLGEIYLFDQIVTPGVFYPEIGFIFQNPDDQLFCPTVRDDIVFGLENLGLKPEVIETRLKEVLALTGISHLVDRVSHHLSGGEKCMVAIATILAMHPQIVLYDEPSANLDLQSRRRLINFLQSSGQTLWIASHDLELILEVCDRVILLNEGHIVADGIPGEVMKDKQLMEANGLEVPYSLSYSCHKN